MYKVRKEPEGNGKGSLGWVAGRAIYGCSEIIIIIYIGVCVCLFKYMHVCVNRKTDRQTNR